MNVARSNALRQSLFLLVLTGVVSVGVATCSPRLVPLKAASLPPGTRILILNTEPSTASSEPLLTLQHWETQWPEVMAAWRPGDPILVRPGPEAVAIVRRLRRELGFPQVQLAPEVRP